MSARSILTRFRAYQLGTSGASFSLFADGIFTLIEARVTDLSRKNLKNEVNECGKITIDELHISSWDQDHCSIGDLKEILECYQPIKIEYPGYPPHTDTAEKCLNIIKNYKIFKINNKKDVKCIKITPEYICNLNSAEDLAYNDVFYHPLSLFENSNDNSTVKLFRKGSFNIASMGDVEDANIGAFLRRAKIFKNEVDLLVLAHHGADCHTNSKHFFKEIRPSLTICCSQYDNQYEHPNHEVRQRLYELNIPLMTTKTGDILVQSLSPHSRIYRATNLISDSEKISSQSEFVSKKNDLLSMNKDAIRNLYSSPPKKKW